MPLFLFILIIYSNTAGIRMIWTEKIKYIKSAKCVILDDLSPIVTFKLHRIICNSAGTSLENHLFVLCLLDCFSIT
jgi:hypothetical protein